ncbi:MAG: hypothetical protein OEY79_01725 [Anaplasmataceae bacterium]|nr:hypothetical protein [Anaplasmataceae bacterium]
MILELTKKASNLDGREEELERKIPSVKIILAQAIISGAIGATLVLIDAYQEKDEHSLKEYLIEEGPPGFGYGFLASSAVSIFNICRIKIKQSWRDYQDNKRLDRIPSNSISWV